MPGLLTESCWTSCLSLFLTLTLPLKILERPFFLPDPSRENSVRSFPKVQLSSIISWSPRPSKICSFRFALITPACSPCSENKRILYLGSELEDVSCSFTSSTSFDTVVLPPADLVSSIRKKASSCFYRDIWFSLKATIACWFWELVLTEGMVCPADDSCSGFRN